MIEGIIKTTPDKEKARSILIMINTTLEMIETINISKFSSNVTKEYYNVLRELLSIICLLDGYKTYGERAHKNLIKYIQSNYSEFSEFELYLIDDLRIKRNKIEYDGFFVEPNYIKRKEKDIQKIIHKAKEIINNKL